MDNQQTIQGNWNEIKGKLLSKWGDLTDDDLNTFNGNVHQLVGNIQRKTGEARETIENFFEQLSSGSAAAIHRAGDSVRSGAQQAVQTIEETYERSADSLLKGYADVEEVVRQRPAKSVMVSFGVGVVTGIIVALLMRRR